MIWFLFGLGIGNGTMYVYIRWQRLLRTRSEWYADPVIKAKFDPNPDGWSPY